MRKWRNFLSRQEKLSLLYTILLPITKNIQNLNLNFSCKFIKYLEKEFK